MSWTSRSKRAAARTRSQGPVRDCLSALSFRQESTHCERRCNRPAHWSRASVGFDKNSSERRPYMTFRGLGQQCPDVVVKVVKCFTDFTEYTTMQYPERHKLEFPAPRPLGFLASENISYIFMSPVPGVTLAQAWPGLQSIAERSNHREDQSAIRQLETIKASSWDATWLNSRRGLQGHGETD